MFEFILFSLLNFIIQSLKLVTAMAWKMIYYTTLSFLKFTSSMAVRSCLAVFQLRLHSFLNIFYASSKHQICQFWSKVFEVNLLFSNYRAWSAHSDPCNCRFCFHLMLKHEITCNYGAGATQTCSAVNSNHTLSLLDFIFSKSYKINNETVGGLFTILHLHWINSNLFPVEIIVAVQFFIKTND